MVDDIADLSTENETLRKIGSYDEKLLQESKAKFLKQMDDENIANLIISRKKKQKEKHFKKAYLSYNKLWESEFDNIVSEKGNVQDLIINQLKLQVHDTYKKAVKLTSNLEAVDESDVINKAFLDRKLLKVDGQFSFLEKD